MDWTTIIVGVLALVGSLAGTYFANSRTTALLEYRLDALQKKVELHNSVVERMALAEKDIKNLQDDIKSLGK